jgi:phosphohistidine swiveling domain-containing protein
MRYFKKLALILCAASVIFASESLDPAQYGGKAHNLSRISCIPTIPTVPFFAVPSSFFMQFLDENGLYESIDKLDNLLRSSEKETELYCHIDRVQRMMMDGIINPQIHTFINNGIEKLRSFNAILGQHNYAVRSSGVIEDSVSSSCAGLYDSFLNVTEQEIADNVKKVWASSFNVRTVLERHHLGLSQQHCAMGVVIQLQINPKTSGVATSQVLSNGYDGIEITATYGFGEGVVGGEITCDNWVCKKEDYAILEQSLGSKSSAYLIDGKIGTIVKKPLNQEMSEKFSLNPSSVAAIAEMVQRLKTQYETNVDVEFVQDHADNIYIVQVRPLINRQVVDIEIVDIKHDALSKVVAKGRFSLPGVKTGVLVYVANLDELSLKKLEPTDILLAHVTTNSWTQHLRHIGGIITQEGAPSSHPMILSREKGITCVLGIDSEHFKKLISLHKKTITLDGYGRCIYEGAMPIRKATPEEMQSQFVPLSRRKFQKVEDIVEPLKKNNMIFEIDGVFYRKTPTYPVTGFQMEVNMNRFLLLGHITGRVNKSAYPRKIEEFSCCKLSPMEEYVDWVSLFSSIEAEQFNNKYLKIMEEFEKVSQDFEDNSKVWSKYIELYTQLRSYIFLSEALRLQAERHIADESQEYHVPKYYVEKYQEQVQRECQELDYEMYKDVVSFAEKLKSLDHVPETMEALKKASVKLYDEFCALAKKYRFEQQISVHNSIDFQQVYEHVKKETQVMQEPVDRKILPSATRYLQDDKFLSLRKWVEIMTCNRVLQCNSHHIDTRSRAIIHPKLLEIEKHLKDLGKLSEEVSIFSLSINDIKKFIDEM